MENSNLVQKPHLVCTLLEDDGVYPNNGNLCMLIYKAALVLSPEDVEADIEKLFEDNKWSHTWKNGILDHHHYHSNTHGVLGVFSGNADLQIGGPLGIFIEVEKSDVLIMPAGVAYKCLKSSDDFLVIGAYSEGILQDMNYGKDGERPATDENILNVPLPKIDPVYGEKGPLIPHWK